MASDIRFTVAFIFQRLDGYILKGIRRPIPQEARPGALTIGVIKAFEQ